MNEKAKEQTPIVRGKEEALKCRWLESIGVSVEQDKFYCAELWCHLTPYTKRIGNIEVCQKCKKFALDKEEKSK